MTSIVAATGGASRRPCLILIHEMARGRKHLYPEWDAWAWWLNVWARNPYEPKPWVGMWGWEVDYHNGRCLVERRRPWEASRVASMDPSA